jgi:uroporphyrinogen-III synthase
VTSRNAVGPLRAALEGEGTLEALTTARTVQPPDPADPFPRICAVGPGTAAALKAAGLPADRIPSEHGAGYTAEGVVQALSDEVEGLRILYPRAEGAREVIPRELGARGATVEAVEAYRTREDQEGARALARGVDRGEVDVITFAAGSAARSFARAWRAGGASRPWPEQVGVIAIGPVTARALEKAGLPVHGTGEPHTLEGLVAAVEAWVRERNG